MTVTWIIDDYILESRSTVGDLKQAVRDAGHNLHVTKYVPFADEQDYGPYTDKDCVVLYGTHGFVSKCKRGFVPGAYGIGSNMNCSVYYSNIPSSWMLNGDGFWMPFSYVKDDTKRIFELVGDNKFFLRPNSGFKTFAGLVITDDNYIHELHCTQQLSSVMPETFCMISPVKDLKAEFRFLIVDGKVVDGSEYRWDKVLDIRHDFDYDCLQMAECMAEHSWQPDSAYICDVALTDDGPKIIEINSFACAGLYALDKRMVVDAISNLAWKEFNCS